jgi:type IV pilus assembly protein PilA
MLQTDQVLGGRYQLQQQLGNNAGRQTWLATDIKVSPAKPIAPELRFSNVGEAIEASQAKSFLSSPLETADTEAQKNTAKGRKSAIYITVLQYIFYVFVFPIVLLGCDFYTAKESRESEVRNNISTLNSAQQAYFSEFGEFGDSFQKLNMKIKNKNQIEKYDYSIRVTPLAVFNYATPRTEDIHSYVGAVFLASSTVQTGEILTVALTCRTKSPGKKRAADPIARGNVIECNPNTKSLSYRDDTARIVLDKDSARIVLDKDSALAYNCLSYATAGQYEKSLEIAQTINDTYWRARALATIAIKISEKGQYDKAVEVARTIKDDSSKQIALDAIARLIRFQK